MGQGAARDATLALVVDLDREAGLPEEAAVLPDAIHEFFSHELKHMGGVCANCSLWAGPAL